MCAGCLRNSTFDSQLLYTHILPKSASISRLDSHTSQKTWNYIKTRGFKPFRDTYLQSAILQSLLNHILTRNRGWGLASVSRESRFHREGGGYESLVSDLLLSTFNCGLLTLLPQPPLSETRFPRRTSNPIGKRVPGQRGWL